MRSALAALVVLGLATTASANGRDPYTSTITFRAGNDQEIVAGMTFGVLLSKDGGATWQWMCERAVGYGGMYDPDYVFTSSGAIFATTFDGMKVMRDGCTFASTPPGMTFVTKVEAAPDGTVYYTASDNISNDSKIYRSEDDGMTFPSSAEPGPAGAWWSSLMVAPSNSQRIYVTGYHLDGTNPKVFLLFTSTDGGANFSPMTMSGITPTSPNSSVELVGVSPTNEQIVYAKVTFESGSEGESVYRSTNAGQTWTKILSKTSRFGIAFLARKDGTCIAGTRDLGSWVSTNCNNASVTPAFSDLAGAPHIGCLSQDSTGVVWACTQNYASPQLGITSDEFGIMKSTDLTTWTGVLKYQDIEAPVACPAGTVQEDQCVQRYEDQQSQWCCLLPQLGITSTAIDCSGALACNGVTPDGPPLDGGTMVKPPKEDCCGAGNGGSSTLLSLLVAGALLLRRKRPKEA